jgi:putative transposase
MIEKAPSNPRLVKKYPRRFKIMDDRILTLHAQGMTTRKIAETFKEMYTQTFLPR